jgi:hypothetical protein
VVISRGTGSSNPSPSSEESTNFHSRNGKTAEMAATPGPFGGWSTSLVRCGLIQPGSAVASVRRLPPSGSRHLFRHGVLATADRSGRVLPVDLLHDFRPPVHHRQHPIGLLGREHRHDPGNAHFIEALHPVEPTPLIQTFLIR